MVTENGWFRCQVGGPHFANQPAPEQVPPPPAGLRTENLVTLLHDAVQTPQRHVTWDRGHLAAKLQVMG